MNPTEQKTSPWPYAIIAFFALLITCVVSFTIFASRHPQDLVRGDYYAEEIRFQGQIDRQKRTSALNLDIEIAYDATKQSISITLPASHAGRAVKGDVRLYRPSDARLDREFPLALDPVGQQKLEATALAQGLWKIRVQWTVDGQEYFVDRKLVVGPA